VRDVGLMPLAAELPEPEHARYEADLAREAERLRSNGMIRLGLGRRFTPFGRGGRLAYSDKAHRGKQIGRASGGL
jgi:hypothetical protein